MKYLQAKNAVISVSTTESLDEAFGKLSRHGIHSMPIYDTSKNAYIGILDIRDYPPYLLLLLGGKLYPTFPWNCRDLLSLSAHRPFKYLKSSDTILNALTNSFWTETHSFPVMDPDNRFIGMASQFSVIKWLTDVDPEVLGQNFQKPIGSLGIGMICEPKPVLSVQTEVPLLKVIDLLAQENLTGCAVEDKV